MIDENHMILWIMSADILFRREMKRMLPGYQLSKKAPRELMSECLITWDCRCECDLEICLDKFRSAARYPKARVIVARSLMCSREDWPGSTYFWTELSSPANKVDRNPLPDSFVPHLHRRDAIASIQSDIYNRKGNIGCMGRMIRGSGYSSAAFSAKFKAMTGRTPKDYANHIRLCHAIWDLISTDRPIKSIARECGYHPFAFSRAFMKMFGIHPSDITGPR